jgi:hypothetical protein
MSAAERQRRRRARVTNGVTKPQSADLDTARRAYIAALPTDHDAREAELKHLEMDVMGLAGWDDDPEDGLFIEAGRGRHRRTYYVDLYDDGWNADVCWDDGKCEELGIADTPAEAMALAAQHHERFCANAPSKSQYLTHPH